MNCPTCGVDGLETWYNKIIELKYDGQREKITYCNYCKTTTSKKEVI